MIEEQIDATFFMYTTTSGGRRRDAPARSFVRGVYDDRTEKLEGKATLTLFALVV